MVELSDLVRGCGVVVLGTLHRQQRAADDLDAPAVCPADEVTFDLDQLLDGHVRVGLVGGQVDLAVADVVETAQQHDRAHAGLVQHIALEAGPGAVAEPGRVVDQEVPADAGVEDGARCAGGSQVLRQLVRPAVVGVGGGAETVGDGVAEGGDGSAAGGRRGPGAPADLDIGQVVQRGGGTGEGGAAGVGGVVAVGQVAGGVRLVVESGRAGPVAQVQGDGHLAQPVDRQGHRVAYQVAPDGDRGRRPAVEGDRAGAAGHLGRARARPGDGGGGDVQRGGAVPVRQPDPQLPARGGDADGLAQRVVAEALLAPVLLEAGARSLRGGGPGCGPRTVGGAGPRAVCGSGPRAVGGRERRCAAERGGQRGGGRRESKAAYG